MIISHKHKYIFIKPRKVAGTSIEVALAKYCGPDDVITPITSFSKEVDESEYEHQPQNDAGFFNHIKPAAIRAQIPEGVWDEYFKCTVVRNPWDMLVSQFHWQQKYEQPSDDSAGARFVKKWKRNLQSSAHIAHVLRKYWRRLLGKPSPRKDFAEFILNLHPKFYNTPYYFDARGELIPDFTIRYEHLDEDYKTLCEKISIPYKELPSLKTKARKKKAHYSTYYTDQTREHVAKLFAQEIAHYEYMFEQE